MPDSTLETELFEDLAVLIAALEAAHGRSERLGVSVDAHDLTVALTKPKVTIVRRVCLVAPGPR